MPTSPAQTLFAALPGAWRLHREIDDARFGAGTFEGRATFSPRPDGTLLYEEHGELRLGAWRGPAWRQWAYALEDDALVIRYPGTNTELHTFRFADDGSAAHVHFCDPDRYSAAFQRLSDGALTLSYVVSGPAKNYRLSARLTHA